MLMPRSKESIIGRGKHFIYQKDMGSVPLAVGPRALHVKPIIVSDAAVWLQCLLIWWRHKRTGLITIRPN